MTAEDGTTKLTYEVTVTRTPQSTDSTLSALSLEDGEDDVLDSRRQVHAVWWQRRIDASDVGIP